jgi:endonuclease III
MNLGQIKLIEWWQILKYNYTNLKVFMVDPLSYSKLKLKEKAKFVLDQLSIDYPVVETPLTHKSAFELLIATMLSPQTTDLTTNKVTPILFEKYPNVNALSNADSQELIKIIRLVNYNKTKARNLIKASNLLIEKFGGKVPKTMAELITLPGVGRKIANVVVSEWYVKHEGIEPEGFVVDTHVARVSNMLKLTSNKMPSKIEKDLMKLFPASEWNNMSLRFIFHGREFAQARNPQFKSHPVWSKVYESLGY